MTTDQTHEQEAQHEDQEQQGAAGGGGETLSRTASPRILMNIPYPSDTVKEEVKEKDSLHTDKKTQKAVGYIRVSTMQQAEHGESLEGQADAIRAFCAKRKFRLLGIYEDAQSAVGPVAHEGRLGLRDAMKLVKQEGAVLVVTHVDRLARHLAVLEELIAGDVQVFSTARSRRVGRKTLMGLLRAAQRHRDELVRRTRAGSARAISRGRRSGNRTTLPAAQRKGQLTNMMRADRKAQELADFIERTPGWSSLTSKERVRLLNTSGLFNLISETRGERKPWTQSSLRKPLLKAEKELRFRRDLEDEENTDAQLEALI